MREGLIVPFRGGGECYYRPKGQWNYGYNKRGGIWETRLLVHVKRFAQIERFAFSGLAFVA
jgi:hypothetical protein